MTQPLPITQILPRDDPARERADLVRLVADDDRVPCVRAALVAADEIRVLREQVDDLALAFVAPLRADDDGRWHLPKCRAGGRATSLRAQAWPDDDPDGRSGVGKSGHPAAAVAIRFTTLCPYGRARRAVFRPSPTRRSPAAPRAARRARRARCGRAGRGTCRRAGRGRAGRRTSSPSSPRAASSVDAARADDRERGGGREITHHLFAARSCRREVRELRVALQERELHASRSGRCGAWRGSPRRAPAGRTRRCSTRRGR